MTLSVYDVFRLFPKLSGDPVSKDSSMGTLGELVRTQVRDRPCSHGRGLPDLCIGRTSKNTEKSPHTKNTDKSLRLGRALFAEKVEARSDCC